jgi:UDP-N-acetylglucosamine acyltransferase
MGSHLSKRSLSVNIHPQAIVSPEANLGQDVTIGPFSIIEPDVAIGDRCNLASRVVVKDGTTLGADNRVSEGAVLGGLPQHTRIPERLGRLVIGTHNTIRENCTIHRALHEGTSTIVGDHNLLMVGAHIAHDCHVGNQTIFANNVLLGGHVLVEDRAFVSGAVCVHQFCRIGRLAMVGGHARVVQDVPPYVMVDGITGCIVGLNLVGLRRNGYVAEEVAELKAAYRLIYRRGLKWTDILDQLRLEFPDGPAAAFHAFLSQGTRGFVQERRMPPHATLKLRRASDEDEGETQRFKAG